MTLVEAKYLEACVFPDCDINEHLPVLRKYTEKCDYVVELGVRGVISTWAFLAGKPKKMISVDIEPPKNCEGKQDLTLLEEVYKGAKEIGVDFYFILGNDLNIELGEPDLLFIDTDPLPSHTYEQLSKELAHFKVKKYIIIHDTTIFEDVLMPAINDFLQIHKNWKIKEKLTNNNGLVILSRKR